MRHPSFVVLAAILVAGCSDDPTSGGSPGPGASASGSSSGTLPPPVDVGPTNVTVFDGSVPIAVSGTASIEFPVPRLSARLHATIMMNASSSGPYALYGDGEPGAQPRIRLTQDGDVQATFEFATTANMASQPGMVAGPQQVTIEDPTAGGWLIEFGMGGGNVRAVILVTVESN